jgi:hypothetical protein
LFNVITVKCKFSDILLLWSTFMKSLGFSIDFHWKFCILHLSTQRDWPVSIIIWLL